MSGLSGPVKKALKGFIEGDYAGNHARVVVALQNAGLAEHKAALDYVRNIQHHHKDRLRELEKMLMGSMMYEVREEIIGTRGGQKTCFSEEDINRMAEARTPQDE
jgi:hypothetical protein